MTHCKGQALEALGGNKADRGAKRAALVPFLAIEAPLIPHCEPKYTQEEELKLKEIGTIQEGPRLTSQGWLDLPKERNRKSHWTS